MRSFRRTAITLLLLSAFTACLGSRGTATRLPIAEGAYYGIAWPRQDLLVTAWDRTPGQGPSETQLSRASTTGTAFEPLGLARRSDCLVFDYLAPQRLPDGRLGAIEWCGMSDNNELRLVAIDLDTLAIEGLSLRGWNAAQFTFADAMDHGAFSFGSALCGGVGLITGSGAAPLDVAIGAGAKSFSLVDAFNNRDKPDCAATGRATLPAWSPDGKTLALFASPQSVGQQGDARLNAPWELYFLTVPGMTPHLVTGDIRSPRAMSWAPDGQSLAFAADLDGRSGLWLLRSGDNTPTLISQLRPEWLAWAPDGSRIVGVHPVEGASTDKSEILTYSVTP